MLVELAAGRVIVPVEGQGNIVQIRIYVFHQQRLRLELVVVEALAEILLHRGNTMVVVVESQKRIMGVVKPEAVHMVELVDIVHLMDKMQEIMLVDLHPDVFAEFVVVMVGSGEEVAEAVELATALVAAVPEGIMLEVEVGEQQLVFYLVQQF